MIRVCCLGTKYGGSRRGLQRLFRQVLVSRKSSVNVCSVVSRTTDETSSSPCPKTIRRRSRHLPFQPEEMSAPRCRSQLCLFYFCPQKPFFSGLTRNHSDLSVFWNLVWASVCPNQSAAGGFLFGSLNWLDMWFSRSGLPDPAAWNKYLDIGQGLRCRRRHLHSNVDQVGR